MNTQQSLLPEDPLNLKKNKMKEKKAEKSVSGRLARGIYEKETRLYVESIKKPPKLFIEVIQVSGPFVYLDIRNIIVLQIYETFGLHEWIQLSLICKKSESKVDLDKDKNNLLLRLKLSENVLQHLSSTVQVSKTSSNDNDNKEESSGRKHPSVSVTDKRMVISGVSSVLRFIFKFVCSKIEICNSGSASDSDTDKKLDLHKKLRQYLGFRGGCLQACSESSLWTKFCEVDMIQVVTSLLSTFSGKTQILLNQEKDKNSLNNQNENLPESLIRFEYHLSLPVKIHNFRKVAQDLRKLEVTNNSEKLTNADDAAIADLKHEFAEGPILLLSDLILYPNIHICVLFLGRSTFEKILPKTFEWYQKLQCHFSTLDNINIVSFNGSDLNSSKLNCNNDLAKSNTFESLPLTWSIPEVPVESLYSRDTSRYKPSLRLFTRQYEIDSALDFIKSKEESFKVERKVEEEDPNFNWANIPPLAHPEGGSLPVSRSSRKCDQLASMASYALQVYTKKKNHRLDLQQRPFRIVDFCSGGGHLGILMAWLLPECEVVLVENKDESLRRAQERVEGLGLTNVFCYQSNLDYFEAPFDLGMALHACGTATDLVLEKCIAHNASFVCCPCCYGQISENHVLSYPRSSVFREMDIPLKYYFILCHSSDQTNAVEKEKSEQGKKCMQLIDSDRCEFARDHYYEDVRLCKIVPESASLKNHILVGVSSSNKILQ